MVVRTPESSRAVTRGPFGGRVIGRLLSDLTYVLRQLARTPSFTLGILLTLGIGIGSTISVFSILNALILKPVPVTDPETLVRVYRSIRNEGGYRPLSYPDYLDLASSRSVFQNVVAWTGGGLAMTDGSRRDDVRVLYVSGNYFDEMVAQPLMGRRFVADDDRAGAPLRAIVSQQFWRRRFAENPGVLGRSVYLNGSAVEIIGIAPAAAAGLSLDLPDLWVPITAYPTLIPARQELTQRDAYWIDAAARLAPGMRFGAAETAVETIGQRLSDAYPATNANTTFWLAPASYLTPSMQREVVLLVVIGMVAVGLVLALACTNAAGLMVSRAMERTREIAIRLSLGATRWQIFQLLLTESLVLSVLGGALGLALGPWLVAYVKAYVEASTGGRSLALSIGVDWRIVVFALAASMLCAAALGLLPALQGSRHDLTSVLKAEVGLAGVRARTSRIRRVLVAMQLSFCLILLIGAGLLLRGLQRAQTVDLGFDMARLIVVYSDLRAVPLDTAGKFARYEDLLERVRQVPGVQRVAMASQEPLGTMFSGGPVFVEGAGTTQPLRVQNNTVSPGFFETLGVGILAGRDFDRQSAAGSVIVNEAFARLAWPGQNPLGKRLQTAQDGPRLEVIGIVRDSRSTRLWSGNEPLLYLPLVRAEERPYRIIVRSAMPPASLVGTVRQTLDAAHRDIQFDVKPLEQNLEQWLWPSRLGAAVSTGFGMVALYLAALGIYSAVAFGVRQRKREIGIRLALGATRADVLRMFVLDVSRLVIVGGAIGMMGAAALTWALARFLYGIGPLDLLTFAAAGAFVTIIAMAATLIPAAAALRIQPATSLRQL